ncbi:MAG: class D sortase [Clostridium sp.]|nr:class D sortase [Clostridium sp.]
MKRVLNNALILLKGIGNMLLFPILMLCVGVIIVLSTSWNIINDSLDIGRALFVKPVVNIAAIKYTVNNHEVVRPEIGEVFAKLKIDSVNLYEEIAHGDSEEELRNKIGHYSGSTLPGEGGNCILCAHRNTAFRPLENVQVNDNVEIETKYGTYKYKVDEIKIIKDLNDASPLQVSDKEMLTLYTCYPFSYIGSSPYRIVFRCSFIEVN